MTKILVMAGKYHLEVVPEKREIVFCNFYPFASPEMIKLRPCVVVSPMMKTRPGLCTIVPLSTTEPVLPQPYNCLIEIKPTLRKPYNSSKAWVKADMLYSVSVTRLDRPYTFDKHRKRNFYKQSVSEIDMKKIEDCILHGLGIVRPDPGEVDSITF